MAVCRKFDAESKTKVVNAQNTQSLVNQCSTYLVYKKHFVDSYNIVS